MAKKTRGVPDLVDRVQKLVSDFDEVGKLIHDPSAPVTEDEIIHWAALAVEARERAAYEESRGSSGVAYRNKAETYDRTAKAMRLELLTGVWHCVCCLNPKGLSR